MGGGVDAVTIPLSIPSSSKIPTARAVTVLYDVSLQRMRTGNWSYVPRDLNSVRASVERQS
jgi:hypothetical protein